MLEQKGAIPKLFLQNWEHEIVKMSWYAEALRVPFTGTKGTSPTPEKQPHTIIFPPPNFTLGTM